MLHAWFSFTEDLQSARLREANRSFWSVQLVREMDPNNYTDIQLQTAVGVTEKKVKKKRKHHQQQKNATRVQYGELS